jgi:hypothetical protein
MGLLQSPLIKTTAESAYQVSSLCYCNSFGIEYDPAESLRWLLKSARQQSVKVQAEVKRLYAEFGQDERYCK